MMPMKNTLYKIGIGVCLPIILFHSELKSQAGTGPAPYCMPAYSQTPCNQPNISNDPLNFINDFVNDFNTAGAVTNITNNNSGCNSQLLGGLTENYFRTSCPTFLRVNPGQVITVNVRSGITFDQGFAVFVDWNNNGVYAMPGEQVCATPGIPIAFTWSALNFTIPGAQPAGNYRMRVRSAYFTTGTTIDPCLLYGFGETEEYNLIVGAGVCVVLPIELKSLEATSKNNDVELSWVTASEKNTDFFIIEKSYDGQKFEFVDQIKAAGNSQSERLYLARDLEVKKNALIYYRLKQFDKGESDSKFTKVITYQGAGVSPVFEIFPNPASTELKLVMPEVLSGKQITVEVYNITGKKVATSQVEIDNMNSPVDFDISSLDKGTYFFKISDGAGTVMKKMLVKQ